MEQIRHAAVLVAVVAVLAFALRFYDCAYPPAPWLDEGGHVAASYSYWNDGQFGPDNWEHPPLRHILLQGFLQLFGDTPYGWRMRNIIFGSLAAGLATLCALQATGSRKAALMAGLLLATDPLHVVLSRYTWEEIYGGAFFLAAIVCYLKRTRTVYWQGASALFMGCALATKWYYVPAWFLLCALSLARNGTFKCRRDVLHVVCVWLLIPVSVYVLSYYPWFGRGYTLGEFVQFVVNAYYSLQGYQLQQYNPNLLFLTHASAREWFVAPIIVGQGTFVSADRGEFIIYMNSLPIWGLTLPAIAVMAVHAARKKSLALALPALVFCATYALYFIVKRPAFIYSAAPLLPFAFIAIAYVIARLSDKFGLKCYVAALALLVGWNLYLYPLVTAKKVPVAAYRSILERPEVKVH